METIHSQEYVEVPLAGIVPVTVRTWFSSSTVPETDGAAGAASAGWTSTVVDAAEVAFSDAVAPSSTYSSNAYESPAVSDVPGMAHWTVSPAPAPVPFITAHAVAFSKPPAPSTSTSQTQL